MQEQELARRCGISLEQMYRRLGSKLLLFSRTSWFEVQPQKRAGMKQGAHRDRPSRPSIAFTQSGVILVGASLGTQQALRAAMALVPLLRTRRRSSKNRERRPRRANDPPRQARYRRVFAKLQAEMARLLG